MYDILVNDNSFSDDGNELVTQTNNNSGEEDRFENNWFAQPANASATNCVWFQTGSVESAVFAFNVTDNCEVHEMVQNTVNVYGNKSENAGNTYPSYPAFLQDNDASGYTVLNVNGEKVENDGTTTSTSFSAVYNLGGFAYVQGTSIQAASNASSVPIVFSNAAGPGSSQWTACDTQNNGYGLGFTELANNTPSFFTSSTILLGCVSQIHNSWLYGSSQSPNPQLEQFYMGGGVYSTVETQSSGGNIQGTFQYWGGTNYPSSTVDVGGSFGRKVCTYNSTTSPTLTSAQCSIYVGLGTATTTFYLPVGTTTQNRDIVIETNTSSTIINSFNSGSSTDCFHLMDQVGNTTATLTITPTSGASKVELVDSGSTCGALSTGDIWEEISKQ